MRQDSINIARLEKIARSLGELKDKVVFTGGATVELYLPVTYHRPIRPTKDVDCIIQIGSRLEYSKFEELLRKHKFKNAGFERPGSPICRWLCQDIIVDFMPTEESILGFSNRWFAEAIRSPMPFLLPSGTTIFICLPSYFLAIKLEVFLVRGIKDIRASWDLEDLITVIDSRTQLYDELLAAPEIVKTYVKNKFGKLLAREDFAEAVECNSPEGFKQAERAKQWINKLTANI